MKRPPDQVPSAVCVGSRGIALEGTRRRAVWEDRRMGRPLVLLLLLVALVAAGCGGGGDDDGKAPSSKQQYGKELQAAGATLQKTFGDISDQTGSNTSSKQIGDRLAQGATAVDQSADKFAKITPPPSAKGAHQKLVDGLHEIADQLRKAADAAHKNDSKSLAAALQSLLKGEGAKKLNQATAELKAQGITPSTSTSTTTTG